MNSVALSFTPEVTKPKLVTKAEEPTKKEEEKPVVKKISPETGRGCCRTELETPRCFDCVTVHTCVPPMLSTLLLWSCEVVSQISVH